MTTCILSHLWLQGRRKEQSSSYHTVGDHCSVKAIHSAPGVNIRHWFTFLCIIIDLLPTCVPEQIIADWTRCVGSLIEAVQTVSLFCIHNCFPFISVTQSLLPAPQTSLAFNALFMLSTILFVVFTLIYLQNLYNYLHQVSKSRATKWMY